VSSDGTTRWSLLLLSGVNLGLLGEREPEVYGTARLEDHAELARRTGEALGLGVTHVHSDHEAELVAAVHDARADHDGIVVNPGAFTHYSWALHDALAAFGGPVVELHLSNPQRRESWRHTSVVSPVADAIICGVGGAGYRLAIEAVAELLEATAEG
jgi:3-dehydroquinate dehydratase II